MASFDIDNFPTSEHAQKMLGYVTKGFYDESYVGKWLFQVIGLGYDDIKSIIGTLPDQFFPETATWGLMYHELKWGLEVRDDLSYEERRALICIKRDSKLPVTPYRMENIIAAKLGSGYSAEVIDTHDKGSHGEFTPEHPCTFAVYVEGEDFDYDTLIGIIDGTKQSHTTYTAIHTHTQDFAVGLSLGAGYVCVSTLEVENNSPVDMIYVITIDHEQVMSTAVWAEDADGDGLYDSLASYSAISGSYDNGDITLEIPSDVTFYIY